MKDWVWENKDKDTSLEVTLKDNMEIEDEWRFSAPMDLSRIEDTVIVLRTVMSSPYRLLLKLQIFKQGHQTYVVFKEITRQ